VAVTNQRMISSERCVLLAVLLVSGSAAAEPCAPAAVLSGDPSLVSDISGILSAHGVVEADTNACPAVRAQVERRGGGIVVHAPGNGSDRERVVSELDTAATVIESWTRTDLDAPLFAVRPMVASRLSAPPPEPWIVRHTGRNTPPRGIQAFGAFETSLANDRTSWLGATVGVCVQIGAVCGSARARLAAVVVGPAMWKNVERHAQDVLFGGDIPMHVSGTTVSFGIAAGMGATHTQIRDLSGNRGSETFGLRGDAHVSWMIPLAQKLAIELSGSLDLAQVTDAEASTGEIADERVLARFGAGLRYGGR
jgi:hypothetical protein